MHRLVAIFALTVGLAAQSAPCPADRPVDEVIAAIQKQQSKKAQRNKSPLPDNLCVIGWCRKTAKTPPIVAQPGGVASEPSPPSGSSSGDSSSSKAQINACDDAMEKTLSAAHDTEVGDYYFQDKNFKAASFRYEDALKNKPDDAAIHVRLGRAYEKLDDRTRALEQYDAAVKLDQPPKYVEEAKAAIARLRT
jgi:hypothetical protein